MTSTATELLTVAQMGEADRLTIKGGISGIELIERAGAGVAWLIAHRFPPQPLLVLCGPGKNGADGVVTARRLAEQGWPVTLALSIPRDQLAGEAAAVALSWGGDMLPLHDAKPEEFGIIVDVLYGAGLNRMIEGDEAELIGRVNACAAPVIAIDVPSGMQGDSGEVQGVAIEAELTITFFRKKPGHLVHPGKARCGEVVLADIGIPATVLAGMAIAAVENLPQGWIARFPWPKPDTNKYTRGHALVISGGMTGAARLAAHATQRIGAGLVTLACPPDSRAIFAADSPSLIVHTVEHAGQVADLLSDRKVRAVLVGPGAQPDSLYDTIRMVIESGLPAVFDAGALTTLSQHEHLRLSLRERHVLTPHEGEFKRLFAMECGKLNSARAAAAGSGATILLKGDDTIIARPDGMVSINSNATGWLATGGSGDTLSGLITGLLAQGVSPFDAASMAAWIHAECARTFGSGLIADDLAGQVPGVLRGLLNH